MKKTLFTVIFLLTLFSCEKKEEKYPKELQKIFDLHGGIKVWKNIKTISFSVDEKEFTFDLVSNKKVVNGSNYSFGFDGKKYWFSEKSPVKNPKEYLEKITSIILTPFLLAEAENIEVDKEGKSAIIFNQSELAFNSKSFKIEQLKSKKLLVIYKEWQEKMGFLLPKKVQLQNKEILFKKLGLSQATVDDRFYQKP